MGFATNYKKYFDTGPFFFFKMPKCASTSIIEATQARHVESADMSKPFFTVVRNPFSRLVSVWNQRLNSSQSVFENSFGGKNSPACYRDFWAKRVYRGMPFEQFVNLIFDLPDHRCECHFCPTSYLSDKCLPKDFIWFKMEELNDTWPHFASQHGFETELPQMKKSEHQPYQELYTGKLQEKVYARYYEDFKRWGYSRDMK